MSEEVAVIIKAAPDVAEAFLKVFPGAIIRKIKKPENKPPEKPLEAGADAVGENVPSYSTPQEKETLMMDMVRFCQARKSPVDAVRFFGYYDGRGWLDAAGRPITDWKKKIIEWESNGLANKQSKIMNQSHVETFAGQDMEKILEAMEKAIP